MGRRQFTRDFKLSAVRLVNEQGYTITKAARSLGVEATSVRYWVTHLSGEAGVALSKQGTLAAEVQRLRKENAQLLMEREILKKAAAFFAREQP